jgi:predicted glycosyltransferase
VGTQAELPPRIWIDLDNTPHVPFFVPIIRSLEREGHSVTVTVRDAFQVCSLADYYGLVYRSVGRHHGANKALKAAGTVWRSAQLLPFVRRQKPDVAMSHGSRPLELVSFLLGIPSMRIFDYEHTREWPLLKPTLGVAPDTIDRPVWTGCFKLGLRSYHGLKEDVYSAAFTPDPSLRHHLGVSEDEILVTVRPPATEAHYHNPESDTLFVEAVNVLGAIPRVRMVILPRTAGAQRQFVAATWPAWCAERRIILPDRVVDGLNLVWCSDLVVSGGGTMNREAAALGVPVYSIFRGTLGAVDRELAREGRLVLLETPDQIRTKLLAVKRQRVFGAAVNERPALRQILAAAHELISQARCL